MIFKLVENLNESVKNVFEFLVIDRYDNAKKKKISAVSIEQAKTLARKFYKGCLIRDMHQITFNTEEEDKDQLSLWENYVDISNFNIGDKVRILTNKKAEYAAHIVDMNSAYIELDIEDYNKNTSTKIVNVEDIAKIKKINDDQDLNSDFYFDDEEKEFWRTHIYSKDGIVDRHSIGMPYLDEAIAIEESKKRKKDPTKGAMGWHQAFTGFNRDPEKSMEIFNHNMTYNDQFDANISNDTSAVSSSAGDCGM